MTQPDTPRPVFVLGTLRSGSNLVALAIGTHPGFAPPIEAAWLDSLAVGLRRAYTEGLEPVQTAHLAVAGIEIETFYERFGASPRLASSMSCVRRKRSCRC
jgi:hypothetical protein